MDDFKVDDRVEFKNVKELYGVGVVIAIEDGSEYCTIRFGDEGGKVKGIMRIKKIEIRKVEK